MINYFTKLSGIFKKIKATDSKGKITPLDETILRVINLINKNDNGKNKIICIGNGGSASIASHIATDFLKNCEIPAIAFNDASLITCFGNDLGYEYIFQKPIMMLSEKGDILFSISSSGRSENILKATMQASQKGCFIITLSGFNEDNPLRKTGDINFHVPSKSYGYVEISHLAILHCIVDSLTKNG